MAAETTCQTVIEGGGYVASVCLLKSELLIDVQASVYRSQRKSEVPHQTESKWRKLPLQMLTAPVELGEYYTMPSISVMCIHHS